METKRLTASPAVRPEPELSEGQGKEGCGVEIPPRACALSRMQRAI